MGKKYYDKKDSDYEEEEYYFEGKKINKITIAKLYVPKKNQRIKNIGYSINVSSGKKKLTNFTNIDVRQII
jgi:hypothetical protein